MKTRYAFLLLIIAVCFTQCKPSNSIGANSKVTNSPIVIPGNLYPSPDVPVATHNDWTKNNYPKMIAMFKKEPLHMHDIVFLGNSITRQGGDWGKRLNDSTIRNRGIAGDVTDGVIHRLGEITFIQPKAVFLEIGINDLFNDTLSPKRTADNILKIATLIHQQSPATKIYVQTVFPTDKDSLISRIRETNAIVSNAKHKVFTLLDTHRLFADEHDKMKKIYTKDGVHLTDVGYDVWVDFLRKYLN
jgi:lysophospholipase L1-like esterase